MVSVVIPIYKVEEYLRECVDSVINQTYTDLEIILVDDGSPDNCGKICDEYASKDSRVVVIHKENGGLSDARNAGLSVVHGDYVYFLDSDDYIGDNAIEHLLAVAEREQADIVCFGAIEFSEDPDYLPNEVTFMHRYETAPGAVILRQRYENDEWIHSTPFQLFRRSFLKSESLLFKRGILYEDVMFTGIAYVRAKRVAVLNERLYFYRIREGSIMNTRPGLINTNSAYVCFRGLMEEKKCYPIGSVEEAALDVQIKHAAWLFINLFCELSRENRKEMEGLRKEIKLEINNISTINCTKIKLKYSFPRIWAFFYRLSMRDR